jgi:cytochrome P450
LATVEIDPLFDPGVVQEPHDYASSSFLALEAPRRPVLRPVVPPVESYTDDAPALVTADPPVHAQQRRIVARALSTASMARLEPEFRSLVEAELTKIPADGRFEWMSQVAEPLPMVMVARILGVPDRAAPDLKHLAYSMLEQISGFADPDRLQRLNEITATPIPSVIDAHQAVKDDPKPFEGSTLVGILAQAVVDGELDDVRAMTITSLLISAGGESTTSLTGSGVRILTRA